MDIAQIREAVNAVPFVPFEIHRADGRVSRVEHPDFIALTPSGRSVVVVRNEAGQDRQETIAVSLIIALHQDVPAS